MAIKAQRMVDFLRAGYSAFWIKTQEPDRVKAVIMPMVEEFERKDGGKYKVTNWDCTISKSPLDPLDSLDKEEDLSVKFLFNYHWFVEKPPIVQKIQNALPLWASEGKAMVIVSPVEKIPVELKSVFTMLTLDLPDDEEIKEIIQSTSIEDKIEDIDRIMGASKGLTQVELQNVLSLSLVVNGKFETGLINEHKATVIERSGFIEVIPPKINFENVVGYEVVKSHASATMNNPKAKGFMVIGPPGCGKTTLMNAIVGESGKLGLKISTGKLFSKFQGETDANVEFVINLIKVIGPCIVLIDEFEKQFAGAGSSGDTDSGVTRRASSKWLEFLQDRPAGVFVVATANSFNGVPPEYLRPGRWDTSPFFIDLPNSRTRVSIMKYYLKRYSLKVDKFPTMQGWSGAEIEACCHIADMHEISYKDAMRFIKPLSATMGTEIEALREWAKTRTINAEDVIDVEFKVVKAKRKIDK